MPDDQSYFLAVFSGELNREAKREQFNLAESRCRLPSICTADVGRFDSENHGAKKIFGRLDKGSCRLQSTYNQVVTHLLHIGFHL